MLKNRLINVHKLMSKKAKIISPLIVVPLSYLGAVLIHGAHPSVSASGLLWSIIFVTVISLPVGYLGLFGIVLPIEEALKKETNCLL